MRKAIIGMILVALALCLSTLALNIHTAIACGHKPPLIGDVNGDGKVDIQDVYAAALAFGSTPTSERWNPKADLNSDSRIDMTDLYIILSHFGDKSCP